MSLSRIVDINTISPQVSIDSVFPKLIKKELYITGEPHLNLLRVPFSRYHDRRKLRRVIYPVHRISNLTRKIE
jgi:hypothetical protein